MEFIRGGRSRDMATGEAVADEAYQSMTRCLAVLVACSRALEQFAVDARNPDVEAALDRTEAAVQALLLSLTTIVGGDGARLRGDYEALAARLGATVQVISAGVCAPAKGVN